MVLYNKIQMYGIRYNWWLLIFENLTVYYSKKLNYFRTVERSKFNIQGGMIRKAVDVKTFNTVRNCHLFHFSCADCYH